MTSTSTISERAASTVKAQTNRTRMVDEDQMHSAMEYLRDSAHKLGQARRRAKLAGHMVKHVEALSTKMSNAKSEAGRKIDARTSEKFLEAIHEDADADGELAKLYALREAASTVVEVWRSQSATLRQATKL